MSYSVSPEERLRLDDLMDHHNIVFSGYQIFITLQPFSFIRRVYGDIKLCIVKFWSTSILCDELNREYNSILLRPLVNPDPARIRTFIPKTEFINGMQPTWPARVAAYVKSDNKKTLVVMEGIIWPEECRIHYERINTILDALSAQK